jgi:hypothetical protein
MTRGDRISRRVDLHYTQYVFAYDDEQAAVSVERLKIF